MGSSLLFLIVILISYFFLGQLHRLGSKSKSNGSTQSHLINSSSRRPSRAFEDFDFDRVSSVGTDDENSNDVGFDSFDGDEGDAGKLDNDDNVHFYGAILNM